MASSEDGYVHMPDSHVLVGMYPAASGILQVSNLMFEMRAHIFRLLLIVSIIGGPAMRASQAQTLDKHLGATIYSKSGIAKALKFRDQLRLDSSREIVAACSLMLSEIAVTDVGIAIKEVDDGLTEGLYIGRTSLKDLMLDRVALDELEREKGWAQHQLQAYLDKCTDAGGLSVADRSSLYDLYVRYVSSVVAPKLWFLDVKFYPTLECMDVYRDAFPIRDIVESGESDENPIFNNVYFQGDFASVQPDVIHLLISQSEAKTVLNNITRVESDLRYKACESQILVIKRFLRDCAAGTAYLTLVYE
jgi:hypothetical protein